MKKINPPPAGLIRFIFLALILIRPLTAQTSPDSIPAPFYWQQEMTKHNTSWQWLQVVAVQKKYNTGHYWNARNTFNSTLLIPAAGKKQWKDENRFSFIYQSPWYGLYGRSWFLDDRQTGSGQKFANHVLGLQTAPLSVTEFTIQPFTGYQYARNRQFEDWGWDAGLRLSADQLPLPEYDGSLFGSTDFDLFPNRKNWEHQAGFVISKKFSDFAADSLRYRFHETQKQFFGIDQDSILQVNLFERNLENLLTYRLSSRSELRYLTKMESRQVSYTDQRRTLLLASAMDFFYTGRGWQTLLRMRTSDQEQDFSGVRTDSRSRQTALSSRLIAGSGQNDLTLDLAYVKLQYDTPDEMLNHDDRDEQRFILNLNWQQNLNAQLRLNWILYGYLFHQIYIFEEQSARNNWNRVIKFNPRVTFSNPYLQNRLSSQVLANYTVYDYDHLFSSPRSFLFRKYTLSDSLTIPFADRNTAGVYAKLELEEKGNFFKSAFSQNIVQSYTSQFLNIFLMNSDWFGFRLAVGHTTYLRNEWRHLPDKEKTRTNLSRGPYFSLQYLRPSKFIFSAYAAFLHLQDNKSGNANYITGFLRIQYQI